MASEQVPDDQHQVEIASRDLQKWFLAAVKWGSVALLLIGVGCFVTPFNIGEIPDKITTARLALIVFVCFAGLLEMFLGVLLALLGVAAGYQVSVGHGDAKASLVSSSPGILLIVCSTFLVAFALSRPITYETERHVPQQENRTSNGKSKIDAYGASLVDPSKGDEAVD